MCRVKDWSTPLQGIGIYEEKAAERVWKSGVACDSKEAESSRHRTNTQINSH